MGFKSGDRATVVRDNYPDPNSRSFVGTTGQVTSADSRIVAIRLDGETKSYGFAPEEVEHA
ncbi:hypothetical protein ACEZCY_11125 [Streptacidiphilus sp. N1-12]|uniref:Uncharacterized protein n=2 Tax=Streptacidiphilus alkalitolerans TaxID=3342712 RepID=A0ABV6V644_9ACTN